MESRHGLQVKLEVADEMLVVRTEGTGEPVPAELVIPRHEDLHVQMNGRVVTGRVFIHPQDNVAVSLEQTPVTRLALVTVADDGLSAILRIVLGPGVKRRLRQTEPTALLKLVVEETPYEAAPFDLQEIERLLKHHEVVSGVDWIAVVQLLAQGCSGECVCAKGKPMEEAEPEHFEVHLQPTEEVQLIGIIPVHPVVSVREGDLIATHVRGKEGVAGVSVLGDAILPRRARPRVQRLGRGVVEDEQGRVFATRSGRVVDLPNLLDVTESLTIRRSHSATDGHIVFDGDVLIEGNVEEGVEIVAGGRIVIHGNVSNAHISSDEGIVVLGGVFSSTLHAGLRLQALESLAELLGGIASEFRMFVETVEQVLTVSRERRVPLTVGRVATKLLQEKYAHILKWPSAIEAWRIANHHAVGTAWAQFVQAIAAEFSVTRLTNARFTTDWRGLLSQLDMKMVDLPARRNYSVDIQVKHGHQSQIFASGNVVATGPGFYRCSIGAGGIVQTSSMAGVVLGCNVMTGNGLIAGEIGSQAEVHTTITVRSREGNVKARLVHPGTTLHMDVWHHKINRPVNHLVWP